MIPVNEIPCPRCKQPVFGAYQKGVCPRCAYTQDDISSPPEDWEQFIDEEFSYLDDYLPLDIEDGNREKIKEFIRSLLLSHEQQVRKKILEKMMEMENADDEKSIYEEWVKVKMYLGE